MSKKLLFIYSLLFCFCFVNGATITSTGTGNWATASSWVGGVVPTINDDVIIATGSTITINTNVSAKSIVINGTLLVSGDRTVTTPAGNTLVVTINGTLGFSSNQSDIRFPDGTILDINPPGKLDESGGCSNNVAVYIGTVKFAVCAGGGNSEYTFDQLNDFGGTLQSNPGSNAPVCEGSTLTFTAAKDGADGVSLSWQWSIKPLGAAVFTTYPANQSVVSFTNAVSGSYEAKLTYTTTYSGSAYTNSKTIFATVNPRPAAPTISASGATTFCAGGSVTLTSSAGTSYLWSTGATTQSIVATTSGSYSVQVGNASSCLSLASASTSVTANPKPATPTITPSGATTFCTGGSVTLTSSAGTSYLWSTGATTQSIVVSTSGSYSVQDTSASGCQSLASASTSVTVNTKPAAPTITPSGATTFCTGDSVTLTSSAGSGYLWSTGATTQSIVVTTSGSYSVQVTNASGCQSLASAVTTVTVKSLLTQPNIDGIVNPTCTSTGSISLSGLPVTTAAVPNWFIQQSGAASATYTGGTGTNATTYTITNLAPGFYNFVIEYGDYCPVSINNVEIKATVTNIWKGIVLGWSKGSAPISTDIIEFSADYQSTGDVIGCSCQVDSGANVLIKSGNTLIITNDVKVAGGTLTFENNASLIQTNNVVNSGSIIYKRESALMKAFDYTYWSSPVYGQLLNVLSPNTLSDKYFSYNNGWVNEAGTNAMTLGKGYIIRVPKAGLWPNGENVVYPYAQPVKFIGVPNNGNILGETVATGKSYLIGNPYPSALDADKFLLANNAILGGTIYFWTHNTAIQQSGSHYVYSSNDYASYNALGGTAAGSTNGLGAVPLGKIAAGQSFFGVATGNGTLNFKNNMRIAGNNSQFFKPSKTNKSETEDEKSRVWLDLTNSGGAFKQTLIGYVAGATNGYDNLYDGASLNGNTYVDFYSINNTDKLVIQGRALPFTDSDLVPLGYKTTIAGDFTISIDHADGIFNAQPIYLEDKVTGTINDLTQTGYTFNTVAGTFDNRFVLRYTNKTLGTDKFETTKDVVLVSVENKEIKINAFSETIDKVFVYDVSGKKIYQNNDVNLSQFEIQKTNISSQILFVKVVLQNEATVIKKVVF
jgi:hypothetical protein